MTPFYEACEARGIRPVVLLRETPWVKAGKAAPPSASTASGPSPVRSQAWRSQVPVPLGRVLARLDVGQGRPAPHSDPPGDGPLEGPVPPAGAVEREFGMLKHEWALLPLRVRGIERVRLHADLTILAQLATALAKARRFPSRLKPLPAGFWPTKPFKALPEAGRSARNEQLAHPATTGIAKLGRGEPYERRSVVVPEPHFPQSVRSEPYGRPEPRL